MKIKELLFYLFALATLVFVSCESDTPIDNELPEEVSKSVIILSEGSFGLNDSKLAKYWIEDELLEEDYFGSVNGRGLGDTANRMLIYGSKLYIVMNVSGTIEVIDPITGKSIKQIPMKQNDGSSKEPRQIAAHGGKVYITSYDDTVTRIDTLTLQSDATITVGMDPDGIAISNGKIYVSNSGGLNYLNGYNNTLSIIDINSFSVTSEIEVGVNPNDLQADSDGDIYISTIGNYFDIPGEFQKLNPATLEVTTIEAVANPGKFIINDDKAYIITGSYGNPYSVLVYDCLTERVITDNFITDGTQIDIIHSISIDSESGDIFIMESDYITPGTVYWFNKDGKLIQKFSAIGVNPTAAIVL